MNRNRQRDRQRDRPGRGLSQGGFGDGLLGEGPSGGGSLLSPSSMGLRESQLALAQSLLHQQHLVSAGLGAGVGGDFGSLGGLAGNMHFLQQQQQMRVMGGSGGGMGGMRSDRKRMGGQMRRDGDNKHRRRDSWGRGDKDRSHGSSRSSGQDQDRSRRNRRDSDKDKEETGEDYDPAEPTEDDEEGGGTKSSDSKLYCHVCNISVYDDESFQRHLNGLRHKARMESVLTAHQMKSTQLKSRLKAEEHLRNIERKGGRDPDYFCKICNNDLAIPWEKHRYSNIHKQRLLQVRKGCGWCKVYDFTNFTEVLEHRDTEEHKKNAELYGKKEDGKDGSSRGRDKKKEAKEEEEEDLTIPEYNAETPVGVSYVIPVTGFFCRLCHKFYNNEKSAKGSHCQSEVHYEKFKAATEAKIAEREKRKAEEEEKRKQEEAEAAKKKEEEGDEAEGKEEADEEEKDETEAKHEMDDEEMLDEDEDPQYDMNNGDSPAGENGMVAEGTHDEDDPESFMESEPASSFVYMAGEGDGDEPSAKDQSVEIEDEDADKTVDSLPDLESTASDTEAKAEIATSTPNTVDEESPEVATPVKRATARRGRGRGRSKK